MTVQYDKLTGQEYMLARLPGEVVYTRTVDDEDISAGFDIDIPACCNLIEIEVLSKSGQAGADQFIFARFNSDTGSNYNNHQIIIDGADTNIVANDSTATSMGFAYATDAYYSKARLIFNPINQGTPIPITKELKYSDGTNHINDGWFIWDNSADDVTEVNIYTANATNSSFLINVRGWK